MHSVYWKHPCIQTTFVLAAAVLLGMIGFTAGWSGTSHAAVSAMEARGKLAADTLQKMVDAAPSGSEVALPAGRYIGSLRIRKPLQIIGSGQVELTLSEGKDPIVSVETDGAVLSGILITDNRDDPDSVAVQVAGSGNGLSSLGIRSYGYGIRLKGAHGNRLTSLNIEGLVQDGAGAAQEEEPLERGNGIDLLESNANVITGNHITNMFDGIYIEKGDSNRVEGNSVTHSRYGYHLMFSRNTVIDGNVGSRNVTGAMIMSDTGSKVTGNDFAKSSENATAQGILLFESKGAEVSGNLVEGNRLGMYAQGVTDSLIRQNRFLRNFVGIQMAGAENTRLEGNEFIANVVQAQAMAGKNNRVAFNYWDDLNGLDLQGDGISDLAYRSDPFFLTLTDKTPAFQLFFGAPGMALLEDLFKGTETESFTDTAPWMEPKLEPDSTAEAGDTGRAGSTSAGAGLLVLSAGIFWIGGRRG